MFRFVSKQAIKAVRRPRLLSSGTKRHVDDMQAPYSGPPSYETIDRRFSTQPDPLAYFRGKRQQEAIQRQQEAIQHGEVIYIHDIPADGGFSEHDVLLTNITHETLVLEDTISERFGITYLSEATDEARKPASVYSGYIYGTFRRSMIAAVVTYNQQSLWIFFIVDTGSPSTFFSQVST